MQLIPTPQVITKEVVDYYRRNYHTEYLKTQWWYDINTQYIDENPDAKCWICKNRKKSLLLLHHLGIEAYEKLFREKLNRDVFTLCITCHKRVHFSIMTGKKTPLTRKNLLNRMIWLRLTHKLRNFRLGNAINKIGQYI